MAEDDSTQPPERRTWLDRIGAMLSGEPSTREDLVELLRDAQGDGLIAADTLRMMEGAIAVSDLTVGDVMSPPDAASAPDAPAVAPGDDLRRVVTLFLERGVDVLRCVDAGGRLVGVVTRNAVAARLAAPADGNGPGAPLR